jgi:enamine deaminase RidA (YjgF/YER057c/UK114 family)
VTAPKVGAHNSSSNATKFLDPRIGERNANRTSVAEIPPVLRPAGAADAQPIYHHAMSTPESRFAALGLELPPPPPPGGVYQPVVIAGSLAYVSGHGPLRPDGSLITGRLGADLTIDQGREAAQQVGLTILSTLRAQIGSLDKINRVVKLLGMVNATPDFRDHPKVINGCSELFAQIWGPLHGVGARSAVGMASLPHQIAVEIEGIFELTA